MSHAACSKQVDDECNPANTGECCNSVCTDNALEAGKSACEYLILWLGFTGMHTVMLAYS